MSEDTNTNTPDPLAAATARIAELESQLAQARAQTAATSLGYALKSARVRPEAMQDAETLARAAIVPQHGPDGAVVAWKLGDDRYDAPDVALAAFLKSRAYLVAPAEPAQNQTNNPAPRVPELQADSHVDSLELVRRGLQGR